MTIIRQETPEDIDSVRYVNEKAFSEKEEADLVERLHSRQKVTLSLVAVCEGNIVGHILFTPVTIESANQSFTAVGLGPMAVLPSYQNRGVGSQLVRAGLEECRRLGHEIVVVLGHPEYYPRFGFVMANSKGIDCEFEAPEEAWMILEMCEGALTGRSGVVKFQPEFKEAM